MSSARTLELLIERATEAYDEATRALGLATSYLDQQAQKLGMLENYRLEYRKRMESSAGAGLHINELMNFRRFLGQLDQAVDQQARARDHAESACAAARQRWQDRHRELKSFEILATRRVKAAEKVAAKKEQNESDGYAARIALHRKSPF